MRGVGVNEYKEAKLCDATMSIANCPSGPTGHWSLNLKPPILFYGISPVIILLKLTNDLKRTSNAVSTLQGHLNPALTLGGVAWQGECNKMCEPDYACSSRLF